MYNKYLCSHRQSENVNISQFSLKVSVDFPPPLLLLNQRIEIEMGKEGQRLGPSKW